MGYISLLTFVRFVVQPYSRSSGDHPAPGPRLLNVNLCGISAERRPRWRVPCCRSGIPVGLRQPGSKVPATGGSRCASDDRRLLHSPSTQNIILRPCFTFQISTGQQEPGSRRTSRSPLPSATSAGGYLGVESHSAAFATGCWACEALRTVNCLRTYLPAVFTV
jgi:hypothetical protein